MPHALEQICVLNIVTVLWDPQKCSQAPQASYVVAGS